MKVIDNDTDQLLGYLVNLTTEGLMLTTEATVETEAQFHLKIVLPAEIKGIKEIILPSTSRWCEKDEESPDFFNVGFQVTDLSKSDAKIIKKLMKKYCF